MPRFIAIRETFPHGLGRKQTILRRDFAASPAVCSALCRSTPIHASSRWRQISWPLRKLRASRPCETLALFLWVKGNAELTLLGVGKHGDRLGLVDGA